MSWRAGLVLTMAVCMAAEAGAAQAGVVIHTSGKDLKTGRETDHQTSYVQNGLVRMEKLDEHGQPRQITLFRDNALWELQPAQHTYTKMDHAAMQQAAHQMDQEMAKMRAQMANMPPEQRAMMEKMMPGANGKTPGAAPPPEGTWTDTGKSETVGQYNCHVWESRFNGKLETQYCVVPAGALPGGDELLSAMRELGKIARELMSAIPAAAGSSRQLMAFERLQGYPVLVRHFSGETPTREDIVQSIERQSLAANQFEIPQGYTERPAFGPPDRH
jgi:hypothetical protein